MGTTSDGFVPKANASMAKVSVPGAIIVSSPSAAGKKGFFSAGARTMGAVSTGFIDFFAPSLEIS
jgi:hypothetical protein